MNSFAVKILDIIRKHPQGISKKEIAEASDIAWGTIFKVTSNLLQRGVLIEHASKRQSKGRPQVPFSVNALSALWCGVDVGASGTRVVFCDMNFKLLYSMAFVTERYTTEERFITWLDGLLHEALEGGNIALSNVTAIGLSISGNVDTDNNLIVSGGNFGIKYGENISTSQFAELWKCPVYAVTTMVAAVAAEYNLGQYRECGNLIHIGLAVGISSGVVANHKLLISHPRRPIGYIGHLLMPDNQHKCTCGFTGCLESYSGGEYLKDIAKEKLPNQPEMWDTAILDRAAANGVVEACEIMDKAAAYNAVGIAAMVQLYSPEVIVFAGGQVRSDGYLFNATLKKLWGILPEERRNFKYAISRLGEFQSAMGAARLAYEQNL